jgi:hypothetical protein
MRASFRELIVAVFNGAPSPQAAESYSAQLTALISFYLCGVALLLAGLYLRAVKRNDALAPEPRRLRVVVAYAAISALLLTAASLAYFYFSVE